MQIEQLYNNPESIVSQGRLLSSQTVKASNVVYLNVKISENKNYFIHCVKARIFHILDSGAEIRTWVYLNDALFIG